MDPQALSLRFPRDVEVVHCLALALIHLNMDDLAEKRELVRFTELRTLAPAPQIPSWISIHLSTNVSGKSYQRWKKWTMDNAGVGATPAEH